MHPCQISTNLQYRAGVQRYLSSKTSLKRLAYFLKPFFWQGGKAQHLPARVNIPNNIMFSGYKLKSNIMNILYKENTFEARFSIRLEVYSKILFYFFFKHFSKRRVGL